MDSGFFLFWGRRWRKLKKVLLFAGTTEGRELIEGLAGTKISLLACVVSEYGKKLLPSAENLQVRVGRMDRIQIAALLTEEKFDFVVDATHPYATEATANLSVACREADIPYYRVIREASNMEGCILVPSLEEAAAFLAAQKGNALLTIGSKELEAFTVVKDYQDRFYVRVLPAVSSLEKCKALGFSGRHILAMQGPFSAQFNEALLKELQCCWLVTKDSGLEGGFPEKQMGALAAGAQIIVVSRPIETGMTVKALLELLWKEASL